MSSDVYEPRIRCAEAFRGYVNQLYQATTLDRNQIMRLMMFTAPFSGLFQSTMEGKLKSLETTLPDPIWTPKANLLWLTQGGEGYELQNQDSSSVIMIVAGSRRVAIAL